MVIVKVEHLMGLIDLHGGFRAWLRDNMWDRVMLALSSSSRVRAIHNYRDGKLSVQKPRKKMWLNSLIVEGDEATLEALSTFVLRAAA
jgi:hypothetical protein